MKTELLNLRHGGKVLLNRQKEIRGIAVQFSFTAGSFNDPKEKIGTAHFCEHALCNFPNKKMDREERAKHKRKYEYINAFTSLSEMCFVCRITEEDFEDAIDFITESFATIKLTQEEFGRLFHVNSSKRGCPKTASLNYFNSEWN